MPGGPAYRDRSRNRLPEFNLQIISEWEKFEKLHAP